MQMKSLTGLVAAGVVAACATTLSAQVVPGSIDPATVRQNFLDTNPDTGIYEVGGKVSRVYGRAFSFGASAVESADAFLKQHAGIFSSSFGQLMPVGPNAEGTHVLPLGYEADSESYTFSLVGYTQHVSGVPVFRGDVRCLVRNEPGYPLVLVANALRDVRDFAAKFTGKPVAPSKLDLRKVTRAPLNQFGPGATVSNQEQVIWAGYEEFTAAEPRLAIKFIVEGTGVFDRTSYQKMLYVVDAETNKILYQEDQVLQADVQVSVTGVATTGNAADACNPEAQTALPHARITYGTTTVFAGVDGTVNIPNGATTLSITSTIGGRWFSVNDVANGSVSSINLSSSGGALNFNHNAANTAEDQRAEVNAYLHANLVRDLVVSTNPSFPTVATQQNFPINVQVSGTCNAFYNGSSINFYPAGGGCNNTAFAPVVHHEYGHHIVAVAGSGQGAFGEGFGDIMAVLVTDDPRLAVGFQTCSTGIRNADNTCQYLTSGCSSCGSAIHSCGQLISGCFWDVRDNLILSQPATYRQTLAKLALGAVLLHAGTGIDPSITIDVLTIDDNNGNINDGTPNYAQINNAFTAHGMPGPALQLISVTPGTIPAYSNPNGSTAVTLAVGALSGTPAPNSGKLFYRVGSSGAFTQVNMTPTTTNNYTANLPSTACGSSIQFYFSANDTTGGSAVAPSGAPTNLYSTIAATGATTPFNDTGDTNLGWSLGAAGDTATSGVWVRNDPLGTTNAGVPVQPENDYSAVGTFCFFTGQGTAGGTLGENDVDGGFTTLVSPTINASGGVAYLKYARWYSNAQGGAPNADVFTVQISNDNGATWTNVEVVGPSGTEANGGWNFKTFKISDIIAATATMKVRFRADDAATGSLIEAAVDDVSVSVVQCAAPGDLNGDGSINAADLSILLGAWGASTAGDVDNDGDTDGADLAQLLGLWNP
jgi:hypothetical protein